MSNPPIGEMLAALVPGARRVYAPTLPPDDVPERFFEVHQWSGAFPALLWPLSLRAAEEPFCGDRVCPRVGIDSASDYVAHLHGASADAGDFYSSGSDIYFMSLRLVRLIESMDGEAIVHRPARIVSEGGDLALRAVMPARVLEAVDPDRTDIEGASRVPFRSSPGGRLLPERCRVPQRTSRTAFTPSRTPISIAGTGLERC